MNAHDPSLAARAAAPFSHARSSRWLGGGTEGNEQLTATTGVVLLVLLAVIGLTILRMHQLISVHLFVGLLLIGPVALKLASTGYRFTRYYTHDAAYRRVGPPLTPLRVIAPIVVLSTLVVFVSGVLLLLHGPHSRGELLTIHKVSFIVWVIFTSLHVLGHLPGLPGHLRAARGTRAALVDAGPGAGGRTLALTGSIVAGLVIALALLPTYGAWTAAGVFLHHHH
jgi:hypothetical protein